MKQGLALICLIAATVPLGCTAPANKPKPVSESLPPPGTNNPPPRIATDATHLPPPNADEVKSAVERIFKGAVTVNTARDHYFMLGDFNGDLSQDLAVVVTTSPGTEAQMNDEVAPWIMVDPVGTALLAARLSKSSQTDADKIRQQVHIEDGEVLLAVIHGFESKGWHDPRATQTYLLKNAVGEKISAQNREQVREVKAVKMPYLRGDVIEQTIAGRSGFLFYNGAKYAWYDSSTYNPGPPPRMVHDKTASARN
jgi:hypothetical protein